jgi:hypothetical protein
MATMWDMRWRKRCSEPLRGSEWRRTTDPRLAAVRFFGLISGNPTALVALVASLAVV